MIILFTLFLTTSLNWQDKFDYCQSIDFEGEYCSLAYELEKRNK